MPLVPATEHQRWSLLSNPPPTTGTMDRHPRGWVPWPITTTTIATRIWRVASRRVYRMYSYKKHTHSSRPHADPSTSLTSGPGFNTQPARQRSSPEDSLFEINQTGLSPMWYDSYPLSIPFIQEPYAFLGETLRLHM